MGPGYGQLNGAGDEAERGPAGRVQQQGFGYLTSESGMKPVLPDKGSASALSGGDPIP